MDTTKNRKRHTPVTKTETHATEMQRLTKQGEATYI